MILTESYETKQERDKRLVELKEQGFTGIVKYTDAVEFEEFNTTWWETRWFVGYEPKELVYG